MEGGLELAVLISLLVLILSPLERFIFYHFHINVEGKVKLR